MTWLNAKNDHVTKYANIYLDKGFDIFNMTCTPVQLMFPTWGTQVNKSLFNPRFTTRIHQQNIDPNRFELYSLRSKTFSNSWSKTTPISIPLSSTDFPQPVICGVKFVNTQMKIYPGDFFDFFFIKILLILIQLLISLNCLRYQPLFDQIKCQSWDSAPDVAEFTVGVARGLFPHNKVLQVILLSYAR